MDINAYGHYMIRRHSLSWHITGILEGVKKGNVSAIPLPAVCALQHSNKKDR